MQPIADNPKPLPWSDESWKADMGTITRWEERAPLAQATKLAGHTKPRMTTKYVKQEMRKLSGIVTTMEQQFLSSKVVQIVQ